ncbi:MAG: leucine-rich repeat domain-containing protein, partial [Bacillales bacterium]|nr:leucine-rich repeat domain-containing protein [Bacillales bacterium]MDY5920303.1 leucine-rich repeat domain-containing protein [Candidatus Enteromonas sp.]
MKYTALYWAMRFFEREEDIFEKTFLDGTHIRIDSNSQEVFLNGAPAFFLNSHESFVKLECINRILTLGHPFSEITMDNERFSFKGFSIRFIVWDDAFPQIPMDGQAVYKSRLVSGVLEYKTKIRSGGNVYDYGLFEGRGIDLRKALKVAYDAPDFIIEENRVMRYVGRQKVVVVPEGIEELESSSFWDNQSIEEVILPDSLINMGGDTFYNCKNLRKVNIPKNVRLMGNNPFAGCPRVVIQNASPYFVLDEGALYTKDMAT